MAFATSHRRLGRRLFWILLSFAPMGMAAGPVPVPVPVPVMDGLSLKDALQRGADHGPERKVAEAPAAGVEAMERASSLLLLDPPTLSLSGGPRYAPQFTVDRSAGVAFEVPVRDAAGARSAFAHQARDVLHTDRRRAREDGALRAGLAWTASAEASELMRLRKEFVDQAVAILEVARKRTHAGVSMPAEVAIAQGDVGLARVGVLEAEGLYVNAMTELRQALGLSPGADLALKGDIEEMTEGPPKPAGSSASAMGADAATSNPTFANLVAQARLNSQERLVLRATMGSRWALSGTVTQEGTGNTVVVGTLSLPIPFFDPAAFETSRLKSKEDAIFAQTERSLSELQMRMRVANHEVTHTREVREALQKDALPALKEALRLAKAQYVAGTQDITMVLLAKQRLLGAEEQVKRNAADILRADLQWSHLQGRLTQEAP